MATRSYSISKTKNNEEYEEEAQTKTIMIKTLDAGTIICLRKQPHHSQQHIHNSNKYEHDRDQWEVLLGQSQVKNWLRSTKDKTVIMRWPGEYKLPGGVFDPTKDSTIRDTAMRELCEEFIGIGTKIFINKKNHEDKKQPIMVLHPTTQKLTIPIRNKCYRMHNFIAYAHENTEWLEGDNDNDDNDDKLVSMINDNLQKRIAAFEKMLKEGENSPALSSSHYYDLSNEQKELIAPELYRVDWIPLQKAIQMMESADNEYFTPVNEWQEAEFKRYNITKRDSMYQTMMLLKEIFHSHST